MTARFGVIAVIVGLVLLLSGWVHRDLPVPLSRFHNDTEAHERGGGIGLVSGENTYFIASGNCYGCHGLDTLGAVWANHDANGGDVNVADAWRSTMMGNSARDPFWKAKVSHEVALYPNLQATIEDKCTSCHAPMGRHNKFLMGGGPYSMAELHFDLVAQDGVSCLSCHKQSPDSIGLSFSGDLRFDTNRVVYGPYDEVFTGAMESFLNVTPQLGEHVVRSELCAGCHTLVSHTVDLNGAYTGDEFVEQATYHEWVNSLYGNGTSPANAMTCQGCHMPRITDGIVIAALYDWLSPRSPFGLHEFAGGNAFMLRLLKDNINELGLTASSVQFDSTIARTNRMLQQNTLLMETTVADRDADTAFIDVKLTNLAGHKFPSGYPARRAFIELLVEDASGNALFRSGGWDETYEVVGHDSTYEPHYDVIRTPDQAQIYELVMGDVNGDKTTVLLRAKEPLKDNRLVPLGFSTSHYAYDTTVISGVPVSDIDFNRDGNGVEGSGTDLVHYNVPMNGYSGSIRIVTRVWYQAVPPRWNEELFTVSTPEIEQFRTMYEAADGTPVLVGETVVVDMTQGIDDMAELGVRIFPNPLRDGLLQIDGMDHRTHLMEVFDMQGALVGSYRPTGERTLQMQLPQGAATYVVVVHAAGLRFVQRVISP